MEDRRKRKRKLVDLGRVRVEMDLLEYRREKRRERMAMEALRRGRPMWPILWAAGRRLMDLAVLRRGRQ